jgi:hypothetical protein
MIYWNVKDMAIGDYIIVQIENKKGDRNLDGTILKGKIKELETKDRLLKHERREDLPEIEIATQNNPRTD